MAGKLTAEQNDRLERVLRVMTHESMSADAVEEVRQRLIWDLEHPQSLEELHAALGEIWAQIGPLDELDQRTADELVGYDEFGLPN